MCTGLGPIHFNATDFGNHQEAPFELRLSLVRKRLAAILLRQPCQNRTPFELGLPGEKPVIPSIKPTAENDDRLVWKDSRGNKTAIELFLREIRGWNTGLRRLMEERK